jgi:hypothetical protein
MNILQQKILHGLSSPISAPFLVCHPLLHFSKRDFEIAVITLATHPTFRAIDELKLINREY